MVTSINSRRFGCPSGLGGPGVQSPSLEIGSLELASTQPDARGSSQGARGSRPGRLGTLGTARGSLPRTSSQCEQGYEPAPGNLGRKRVHARSGDGESGSHRSGPCGKSFPNCWS